MYVDDIKIFAQNKKRTGDPNTKFKNILPDYSNGIWHWKVWHIVKVNGKEKTTEEIKLPHQENIWLLRAKVNYKSLRILETGNIKRREMKEKITSEERVIFLKPNSTEKSHQRINTRAFSLVRYPE